ncbi:hypothetical protein H6P81_008719 [Aristolochia fimbriata]|uniref:Uncharacterized protein n=1 Tax=Aristolochia fimbriata TaxID=158543 RepID=A0AAV7EJ43_ARIFI|nr:hypothetical protein H6P81_008719 [Aristolochia fimbriata]
MAATNTSRSVTPPIEARLARGMPDKRSVKRKPGEAPRRAHVPSRLGKPLAMRSPPEDTPPPHTKSLMWLHVPSGPTRRSRPDPTLRTLLYAFLSLVVPFRVPNPTGPRVVYSGSKPINVTQMGNVGQGRMGRA